MRLLFAFSAVLIGSACATPAQTFQYDKTKTANASFDETWSRAIEVFASKNIPIKTLEKDSGIIVAENELVSTSDMAGAASCPSSVLATPFAGVMNFNVFVRAVGANSTNVTVNTAYRMTYRDMNGGTISQICNSNGSVERALLNTIAGPSQNVSASTKAGSEDEVKAIIESVRGK